MADYNDNIWAPWRMEYIRSLEAEQRDCGCFLCHYWQHPDEDRQHHVLWRGKYILVMLNRFPYTSGHLLIAPSQHVGQIFDLDHDYLVELTTATRDALLVLTKAIKPNGFNVGYNIGRCAGAGLPDHIHAHVVPRWDADTNSMAVLGGIRVIPDGLDATFDQLITVVDSMGLADQNSDASL